MKRVYLLTVTHKGETTQRAYEDRKMAKAHRHLVKNADKVKLQEVMLVDRHDIALIPVEMVTDIAQSRPDVDDDERPTSPYPWTSHGHLVEDCDMHGWAGYKPAQVARCGGPKLCGKCSSEALKIKDGQKK